MVKCKDCGFLALQFKWAHGKGLAEANQDFRNTGSPGLFGNSEYELDTRPICFVRHWNLSEDIKRIVNNKTGDPESANKHALNPMPQEAFAVIDDDRECNDWTQWHQGSTPKEQREMLDRDASTRRQEQQNRLNLLIALAAVIVSFAGIGLSAYFNLMAARIQADAQIRAADMQIQALKSLSSQPTSTK